MSISSKVAGTWQTMSTIYAKRSGVWETVKKVYSKQAGVWQQVYAFLGIAWTLKASFAGKRVGFVYYHAANATYYAPVHEANGSATITLYTSTDLTNWSVYGTLAPNTADFGGNWSAISSKIVIQYAYSYTGLIDSKVKIRFEGVWYNSSNGAADFSFVADVVPSTPPPNALSGGWAFTPNGGTSFTNDTQLAKDGTYTMVVGSQSNSQLGASTKTQRLGVYDLNGNPYSYSSSFWIDTRSAVTFPLKKFTGVAFGAGKWVMVGSYQYLCVANNLTTSATRLLTLLGSDSLNFGGITFGNGTFVAISEDGKVITSTDAVTWTSPVTFATGYTFTGLFYYKSLFVAVSQGGGQLNAWSSVDGVLWIKNPIHGVSASVNLSISYGPYPMVSGNATTLVASGDTTGVYAY